MWAAKSLIEGSEEKVIPPGLKDHSNIGKAVLGNRVWNEAEPLFASLSSGN